MNPSWPTFLLWDCPQFRGQLEDTKSWPWPRKGPTVSWKTSGLGLGLKHAVFEPTPVSPLERCKPHNLMLRWEHVSLFYMHKQSALCTICTNCFLQATKVLGPAGTWRWLPSMVNCVKSDLYCYTEEDWLCNYHSLYRIIYGTHPTFARLSSIRSCYSLYLTGHDATNAQSLNF